MFNFFNRSPQKNEPQNFPNDDPPQGALEQTCYSSCYNKSNSHGYSKNDGNVTLAGEIERLIEKAKNHMVGSFITCPICRQVSLKKSHKKITCSNACRQALYRFRRDKYKFTHYLFNNDGSITQLNRWHQKHITVKQLDTATVNTAKHIHQITQGDVINSETLEKIKERLGVKP